MAFLPLLTYIHLLSGAQGTPCENGKCAALEGPQLLQASSVKQRIGTTKPLSEKAQELCDEAVKSGKKVSVLVTDKGGNVIAWATNAPEGSSSLKYNPIKRGKFFTQEGLKLKADQNAKDYIKHWDYMPGKDIQVTNRRRSSRTVRIRVDGVKQGTLFEPGHSDGQLTACQGNCYKDGDCGRGLLCYKRNLDSEPMPFCSGEPRKDKKVEKPVEYCYKVEKLFIDRKFAIVISVGGVEGVVAFPGGACDTCPIGAHDHWCRTGCRIEMSEADLIAAAEAVGFEARTHTGEESWRSKTWEL